ncbi:MAG: DUF420 domain-containing protein [Candidatus Sumerlaeaceae bacterium]|nr:DUF420 domain-containing protein [Candidatus Sumerlaeaceae bacterium]
MLTIADLPAVNATLNATSAVLLTAGWAFILSGRRRAHTVCMISALVTSALFLASYLVYHYFHGSTRFPGTGTLRAVYLAILLSHTVLAIVILPMIAKAVWHAARREWDRHRRIARWTLPMWLYVSVTGVVIYWMLYRIALA